MQFVSLAKLLKSKLVPLGTCSGCALLPLCLPSDYVNGMVGISMCTHKLSLPFPHAQAGWHWHALTGLGTRAPPHTHTHLPSLTLPCSHRCCFPPLPHKHTHSRVLLMQGCTHTQECTSQVDWQTAILCSMSWSTVDRPAHTAGVSLEPPLLTRIKGHSTLEGSQCQSTRES